VVKQDFFELFHNFRRETRRDFEAVKCLMSEDFVWINILPEHVPFGGIYRGAEGLKRYHEELSVSWVLGEFEFEEYITSGTTLVLVGTEVNAKAISTGKICNMPFPSDSL